MGVTKHIGWLSAWVLLGCGGAEPASGRGAADFGARNPWPPDMAQQQTGGFGDRAEVAAPLNPSVGSNTVAPVELGVTPIKGEVCASVEVRPVFQRTPGNLLVIFDRSFSMTFGFGANGGPGLPLPGLPAGPGQQTRLLAVNDALLAGLQQFICEPTNPDEPPCVEALTVGAILFPSADGLFGGCAPVHPIEDPSQIIWQPVSQFMQSWNDYWAPNSPNAILPAATPIPAAFEQADLALQSAPEGNTSVLFLTDGESTCLNGMADPAAIGVDAPQRAMQWLQQNIRTYVVSVADLGSAYNDSVAQSGGTDSSLNPSNPDELNHALSGIIEETVSDVACLVNLEGKALNDLDAACMRGEVLVGPQPISCDPTNGFQIRSSQQLELVGDACNLLQQIGTLRAEFPCELLLE